MQATKLVSIGQGKGLAVLGVETRELGAALTLLSVPLGTAFFTDITTMNTTPAAVTKDFMAAFGRYDPATKEFMMYWGHVSPGVSIPTGEATTTVDCVAAVLGIDWDVLGAFGTYDAATETFTMESGLVLESALSVTGTQVTGLALRR